MLFWLLFRVCERILVERLTKKRFGWRWMNQDVDVNAPSRRGN